MGNSQMTFFSVLVPPIVAITEINIYKAFNYFVWTKDQAPESNLSFRKLLALSFINNDCIRLEEARTTRSRENNRNMEHVIVTAPPHASLYVRGIWQEKARQSTNNLSAEHPVAKNKSGPIAVVVLGSGCAKIATINT